MGRIRTSSGPTFGTGPAAEASWFPAGASSRTRRFPAAMDEFPAFGAQRAGIPNRPPRVGFPDDEVAVLQSLEAIGEEVGGNAFWA